MEKVFSAHTAMNRFYLEHFLQVLKTFLFYSTLLHANEQESHNVQVLEKY